MEKGQMQIIVSITTIPPRFKNIHKTLDSLCIDQSRKPDIVCIHISKKYERFNDSINENDPYVTWLQNRYGDLLYLNFIDNDYGPGTKILGMFDLDKKLELDLFNNKNVLIVICDDDLIYKKEALRLVANNYQENADKAISYGLYTVKNVDIGVGSNMIAMSTHYLKDLLQYFNVIKEYKCLFFHDDVYISYYLKIKNIPIERTRYLNGSIRPYKTLYDIKYDKNALKNLKGDLERDYITEKSIDILDGLMQLGAFEQF